MHVHSLWQSFERTHTDDRMDELEELLFANEHLQRMARDDRCAHCEEHESGHQQHSCHRPLGPRVRRSGRVLSHLLFLLANEWAVNELRLAFERHCEPHSVAIDQHNRLWTCVASVPNSRDAHNYGHIEREDERER